MGDVGIDDHLLTAEADPLPEVVLRRWRAFSDQQAERERSALWDRALNAFASSRLGAWCCLGGPLAVSCAPMRDRARRYLTIVLLVLGLTVGGGLLVAPGSAVKPASASAASDTPIGFSVPTLVDPIHTFGEPTISVDEPTGEVFASGPTGTGTQRSLWEGSFDGGQTFRVITPNAPPTAIQSTQDPPGGGDTDLNFDHTGKEYFADLYALACLRSATTSDGGATVNQGLDACGQTPGADRQWLAVYDPPAGTPHQSAYTGPKPLVYLEFNNLTGPGPNGGAQWNKSTDGVNYTNATNGVNVATESTYSPFGPDGYPAVDQQTGKVFQAASFPNPGGTYDLRLNIGTPDSAGQPHLPGRTHGIQRRRSQLRGADPHRQEPGHLAGHAVLRGLDGQRPQPLRRLRAQQPQHAQPGPDLRLGRLGGYGMDQVDSAGEGLRRLDHHGRCCEPLPLDQGRRPGTGRCRLVRLGQGG